MHISAIFLNALLFHTITIYAKDAAAADSVTTTLTDNVSSEIQNNTSETPPSPPPVDSTNNNSDSSSKKDKIMPFIDAIGLEWKQICNMGCQPGTWPGDVKYVSQYVVPELISIQYKPTCKAKSAHLTYFREISECSGRRDLCKDMDKSTMKCRDKAMRKVTSSLKHLGEGGMDCEKDGDWQGDFFGSVLDFMRYFRSSVCPGVVDGGIRDCRLMGTCMSSIHDS